ncbi:HupE/UreJ family protein [Agromyces sp. NPDC056379]|uniref:HupE/UreJ family protein n=1 Tax=unclassified Agromyces TaxID=2639701 RepID=UPI0035DD0953
MRPEPRRERSARLVRALLLAVAALALLVPAAPAAAHSYAATVFATVTEPEPGLVRTVLEVEYVLLATDGAREMNDSEFEADAYADVQSSGRDPSKLTTAVLERHSDTVLGYVLPRYSIAVEAGESEETGETDASAEAGSCPNALAEPYAITMRDGVPHARLVIDADCRAEAAAAPAVYRINTELFPGTAPGGMTTTIVSYDLRSGSGVANLDTDESPTMTTSQDWGSRMGEFLVLGAEHLLFGPDHLLFLLALIAGARRLRDIVIVATAFTVAHSMTFVAAALGLVSVPAAIVEPIIAFSIAAVALWNVWVSRREQGRPMPWFRPTGSTGSTGRIPSSGAAEASAAVPASTRGGTALLQRTPAAVQPALLVPTRGFSREDLVRVAVVFMFGLVHGVGFAGALGIEEPFSWGLLGALLVFNVGIELTQLLIIAVAFPLLVLLRRRLPAGPVWIQLAVAVVGLFWFVERLLGAG